MYKLASLIQAQRYNFMGNYKFTLSINQYGAVEYNKRNPGKEIDLLDIILLTEINTLINEWDEIKKKYFNQKEFFWIAYSKLIKELPALGINTNDGIYRRLRKIESYGLIEKETYQTKKENCKTYFRLTAIGLQTVTLRMDDRNPYGWKTATPTDGKPDNKNTINKKTKDERAPTHFEFLYNKFPNEINSLKEKYKLPNEEWRFLIDDFNQRRYNKKTVTVTTFEKLLKGYYRI